MYLYLFYSPHSNLLVGRDGAATSDLCFEQYVQSWGPLKVSDR
jgi:hypothetical protein